MAAERLLGEVELYRFNEHNNTYSSSCVLVYNDDVVEVKGLSSKMTTSDWRELWQHLYKAGVSYALYERRKSWGVLYKKVKIKGA